MRDLSWKGKASGVVFGFLKQITFLKDQLQTDRVAFCFDHPPLERKRIYPAYKQRRHDNRTPEETHAAIGLQKQLQELRSTYLPRIGFKNIFWCPGMEADDVMAAIARDTQDEAILITGDMDLLQCLTERVMLYSPIHQKMHTLDAFVGQYGFHPRKWAMVKAIAGCKGDGVAGIPGVGEKTALAFVQHTLAAKSRQYQAILSDEGKETVRRNRKLVQLPYVTCPSFPTLREDEINRKGWEWVCAQLGMRSIAGRPPVAIKTIL